MPGDPFSPDRHSAPAKFPGSRGTPPAMGQGILRQYRGILSLLTGTARLQSFPGRTLLDPGIAAGLTPQTAAAACRS